MSKIDVSVIIRCRNEFPLVIGTIHALINDLEWVGLGHEIIVVDNGSTDDTASILRDRFRRWVRVGLLKVIELPIPSTWQAIDAGLKVAEGDVLMVCDAHISLQVGTTGRMYEHCIDHEQIWHASVIQRWGEPDSLKTYGYDLKLRERFWGDACRYLPEGVKEGDSYAIPMAGACFYAVNRAAANKYGLYDDMPWRAYGGGEPYLCMKWWRLGIGVMMDTGAVCRHAFGYQASWRTATRPRKFKGKVALRDGTLTRRVESGQEFLSYAAGYAVNIVDQAFNFIMAADAVGGVEWAEHVQEIYAPKVAPPDLLQEISTEAQLAGAGAGARLSGGAKFTLDELLADPPWRSCSRHNVTMPGESPDVVAGPLETWIE